MNKTKGGIILVVLVAALALTPIAIYSTQVDVAQVSFDLSVDSTPTAAALSDLESLLLPSFTAGLSNVQIDVSSMNPYEYALARNTARTQVSNEGGVDGALVDITITFNLTTPSNNSLIFVLTPGSMGTGDTSIVTLLGPEDGISTTGEFHLRITITIVVTPPGFDNPVVDITLDPVDLTFTVPTGS